MKIILKYKESYLGTWSKETVTVRVKKVGYNKYFGRFNYSSGRAAFQGRGKIWLIGGSTKVMLGGSSGSPIFTKRYLH